MIKYKTENNADLEFNFPDELHWEEFDVQGRKRPEGMQLIDFLIDLDSEMLLVEVKDFCHHKSPPENQQRDSDKIKNNDLMAELVPKIRDSYTFLHLMKRDKKDFIYVVLLGVSPKIEIPQLMNFKDRLLQKIRCEAQEEWKRKYIRDCVVLSVEQWNNKFSQWPIRRLSEKSDATETDSISVRKSS